MGSKGARVVRDAIHMGDVVTEHMRSLAEQLRPM